MSYTVDLIVGDLPEDSQQAWVKIEVLRETYYEDKREKAPALLALHAALTKRYPCLCSYGDDDPARELCPWADGPMLGNFAHDMGMLAISFSRVDEVVPFIIQEATARGIVVADGQSGELHRTLHVASTQKVKKPWWKF